MCWWHPLWPYVFSVNNIKDERRRCSASLWWIILGARLSYSCKSRHVLSPPSPIPPLSSLAHILLWSLKLCYLQGRLFGTRQTKELVKLRSECYGPSSQLYPIVPECVSQPRIFPLLYSFLFIFKIFISLKCSWFIVLLSGVQQSNSYSYTYSFQILFYYMLLQETEYSSCAIE